MEKIIGVYKITNTVTNDFYIGSSKDVKHRLANHKCPSTWKDNPNSKLYKDMQKYGVDKFDFQILANVESEYLKDVEQKFIEKLQPTYNNRRAKDCDIEKFKKCQRKYRQSEKGKKAHKKYCNKLCSYNGETLTLNALSQRFIKAGVEQPTIEARKHLLNK